MTSIGKAHIGYLSPYPDSTIFQLAIWDVAPTCDQFVQVCVNWSPALTQSEFWQSRPVLF